MITRGGPDHTLWFNYANNRTSRWDKADWKASQRLHIVEFRGFEAFIRAGPTGRCR